MIILDVVPVPKPRMTQRDRWAKRPAVLRYRNFCDELRKESQKALYMPTCPLSVAFILPMPMSWSGKKKKAMNGEWHTSRPDLDNLMKAFKDALLEEDSAIHTYGFVTKLWGFEGKIIIFESGDQCLGETEGYSRFQC